MLHVDLAMVHEVAEESHVSRAKQQGNNWSNIDSGCKKPCVPKYKNRVWCRRGKGFEYSTEPFTENLVYENFPIFQQCTQFSKSSYNKKHLQRARTKRWALTLSPPHWRVTSYRNQMCKILKRCQVKMLFLATNSNINRHGLQPFIVFTCSDDIGDLREPNEDVMLPWKSFHFKQKASSEPMVGQSLWCLL